MLLNFNHNLTYIFICNLGTVPLFKCNTVCTTYQTHVLLLQHPLRWQSRQRTGWVQRCYRRSWLKLSSSVETLRSCAMWYWTVTRRTWEKTASPNNLATQVTEGTLIKPHFTSEVSKTGLSFSYWMSDRELDFNFLKMRTEESPNGLAPPQTDCTSILKPACSSDPSHPPPRWVHLFQSKG